MHTNPTSKLLGWQKVGLQFITILFYLDWYVNSKSLATGEIGKINMRQIRELPDLVVFFNETLVFGLKQYMELDSPELYEHISCEVESQTPENEHVLISFAYDIYYKTMNIYVAIENKIRADPSDFMTPHHYLTNIVCYQFDEQGQRVLTDNLRMRLNTTVVNPRTTHYLRFQEHKHIVWKVRPGSEFKVPLDWSWVFTNSVDFIYSNFDSGRQKLYPSEIRALKPITTANYSKELMGAHPYFKSVWEKERDLVKFVVLYKHAIFLSNRMLKDLAELYNDRFLIAVYKIDHPDQVLEDDFAASSYPHWGDLILNSQLMFTNQVDLIKLCNTRAMIYGYSSDNLNDFGFGLIDTERLNDIEYFYMPNANVSNCKSLSRSSIYSDQYIVDCIEYNKTANAKTGWISFTLSFRPFVVRIRARQDLRTLSWRQYSDPGKLGQKDDMIAISLRTDQVSRVEAVISFLMYHPSIYASLMGTFSTSISSNAGPDEIQLKPVSFGSQIGYFSDFCMVDSNNMFWINSNKIVSGSLSGESVIFYQFNSSLIMEESQFYCIKNKKALMAILTYDRPGQYVKKMVRAMVFSSEGKLLVPKRIPFQGQLTDMHAGSQLFSDLYNPYNSKYNYLYTVHAGLNECHVMILQLKYDFPDYKILDNQTTGLVQRFLAPVDNTNGSIYINYKVVQPADTPPVLEKTRVLLEPGQRVNLFDIVRFESSIVDARVGVTLENLEEEDESSEYTVEQALKLEFSRETQMTTKPWQIAIHKSTMYVIEQKTAMLHLFNITDKLTNPTESLRFGSGSICLGVTSPKIEVLTVDETTILILSNSGFKRGYEDLMYCVFAIANRPERQLVKLTSLSGRTGDYFLKVRQTPKHGTLFCFYNEQEISLEVVDFLRNEVSRHDTFNQYSLTSLALIDSNPFHHVMTNFHNVDYWIDPQDGLMYIFACSSYRTSFILPHKLYTIEGKTKYYPVFEKKIRFEYLDRLISADCKSSGVQFECVCATQNLNIIHRRYVRVQNGTETPSTTDPRPDFELKDEIEYEMPTHGTLQKICVLTRHLVVIFKEEKTLYTVVFEKWRKYSLQHLTLNFESDELLDCNIDESTLPATDKLYYLNSFKRVYSYNISAPMLKRKLRKSNATNTKWFSLQDDQSHKDEISLRVKGINSTVVLRLPTSRVHAKTHWKALLFLVLCLVGLVLSRVLGELWYFTKTKYEFLGKSMLEYEEGTASLYSKPLVHEDEESANYLSFILRD